MTFRTNFLSPEKASEYMRNNRSPLYVYSRDKIAEQAKGALALSVPYGLTVRYAMKANPHSAILETIRENGVKIDASSAYEIDKALAAGFEPADILLTSQQLAHNLKELVDKGVNFNATSLRQLEEYGKLFPDTAVTVRINPGIGSGHSVKTNVGGLASSFGIWHEYIPQVLEVAKTYNLTINRLHTHIGSGADPAIWQEAISISLGVARQFTDITTLNLGGGFKVARMDEEKGADMSAIGDKLSSELQKFADATGKQLHLEIEPGTFLVANAGILIAQVQDIVDTGEEGYTFLKLNTGMNDILRPSLYGAQHPIEVVNGTSEKREYVVVGHNCESGDLLTPDPSDSESIKPRLLNKASVGDIVLIGGVGAYCAAMSAHGYNSFPDAQEIMI